MNRLPKLKALLLRFEEKDQTASGGWCWGQWKEAVIRLPRTHLAAIQIKRRPLQDHSAFNVMPGA